MRHRWRYRTGRVRRLRRLVDTYRCVKCKAWDWEDLGDGPVDPFYSVFVRVWRCRRCGQEDWT